MVGTNDYKPFGSGTGANILSVGEWTALAARQNGFVPGIANSTHCNTAWHQSSVIAAMIGQFIADEGYDALDDGDLEALQANFEAALRQLFNGEARLHVGTDTGTANHIVANVAPDITAYAPLSIYLIKLATTNTTSVDANLDGLGVRPVRRRDGAACRAGDLVAGTIIALVDDGTSLRCLVPVTSELAVTFPRIPAPNTIYYVRPDGSDANEGLANTAAGAFQTVNGAITALGRLFLAGGGVTIKLGLAATYPLPNYLPPFTGEVTILGDEANPGSYILSGAGPPGQVFGPILVGNSQQLTLKGLTVLNTSSGDSQSITVTTNGSLTTANVRLSASNTLTVPAISVGTLATAELGDGTLWNLSATSALYTRGGFIGLSGSLSIFGSRSFPSGTARAVRAGQINARSGTTFSGSSVDGPRYALTAYSMLDAAGAGNNFMPGNAGPINDGTGLYFA